MKRKTDDERLTYTIEECARLLGIGRNMAYERAKTGEIPVLKIGKRFLVPKRALDKLLEEGKPDKLGENVKCVVSVSMLTEGWDANTVTHIMGVRAFGTQLLCEQVVGRGLRRMSYVPNSDDKFDPEYAEVYGVPFSFIPCSGSATDPKPGPMPTRVRALEERIACEITFPRLTGYRYDLPRERLTANFNEDSRMSLSTRDIPTRTENAPIVGETSIHTLDDLKNHREQEVAFLLARLTLDKYFRDDDGNDKPWLFPQLVGIARQWLKICVTLKDNTFPQLLLLIEFAHDATDRIYKAIIASQDGPKHLKRVSIYAFHALVRCLPFSSPPNRSTTMNRRNRRMRLFLPGSSTSYYRTASTGRPPSSRQHLFPWLILVMISRPRLMLSRRRSGANIVQ